MHALVHRVVNDGFDPMTKARAAPKPAQTVSSVYHPLHAYAASRTDSLLEKASRRDYFLSGEQTRDAFGWFEIQKGVHQETLSNSSRTGHERGTAMRETLWVTVEPGPGLVARAGSGARARIMADSDV